MPAKKKRPGLYANIHAKQQRIAHGSGEKMRKPNSPGAPSDKSFAKSAKTAKGRGKGHVSRRHMSRRRAKTRARRR